MKQSELPEQTQKEIEDEWYAELIDKDLKQLTQLKEFYETLDEGVLKHEIRLLFYEYQNEVLTQCKEEDINRVKSITLL